MTCSVDEEMLSETPEEGDDATTIYLVDDGDLRLNVTCPGGGKKRLRGLDSPVVYQKTFVVSSAVMRIASPVWRTMFDPQGPFMDTQRSLTQGEIDFPEDDADALLCILRIAHLQFQKIPETLNYAELLKVAVICDKYDTVSIVRPWIAKWEQETKDLFCHAGLEGYLFISWAFGDYSTYQTLASFLIYDSTSDKDGRLLNTLGHPIGDNFPPAAFDTVSEARQTSIAALLDACYKLVDRYQSDQLACQAYYDREECDTLVFGSLIKGLKGLGIWPTIHTPGDYHGSVSALMTGLPSLHCFVLQKRGHSSTLHMDCKFTERLKSEIERIKKHVVPSGVHDSHREHMKQQSEK